MSNANLTTGLAAAESAVEEMRQAGFVEVPTVFSQTSGGGRYILFPRTVAANVDMGDGSSALERIRLLERGLAANTTTTVVETIAERDLITGKIPGDRCYVIDATDDPGVEKGGAGYIWMPAQGDGASYWRKITEEESQDVILQWENITGRPEQPAAGIDKAALLAKKALMRPLDQPNADPFYRDLEAELLEKVNRKGIGPQGFGGRTTALGLNIEVMPTHIAGLPCAVNINCHVTRHQSAVL